MEKTSPDFLRVLRAERKDLLNRMRQTRFESLKDGYSYSQVIPFAGYSPWLDDETFTATFDIVKACTMVDIYRCYELYRLAQQMHRVAGAIVEVGVWRGGTAALMACALPGKEVHLFDTFSGVAKHDPEFDTFYAGGEHADTDEHIVAGLFRRIGATCQIHRGIFPDDTLSSLPKEICLAHIDVDTYQSVKQSFLSIWPRVQPNGIVVFDDYGMFGCEGAMLAINEIVAGTDDGLFIHNLNGHALLVKQS
ncbi:TylF/MycF/NovP-related O-methyltransferase [Collimonas sp. NPDC087041]|uniref:TylF/MycF/NovP-related O-methyltransferase n=1 Tax=Collimonas sp. NPDC087041 TaxID=3363960 RepID=UPI0038046255